MRQNGEFLDRASHDGEVKSTPSRISWHNGCGGKTNLDPAVIRRAQQISGCIVAINLSALASLGGFSMEPIIVSRDSAMCDGYVFVLET